MAFAGRKFTSFGNLVLKKALLRCSIHSHISLFFQINIRFSSIWKYNTNTTAGEPQQDFSFLSIRGIINYIIDLEIEDVYVNDIIVIDILKFCEFLALKLLLIVIHVKFYCR